MSQEKQKQEINVGSKFKKDYCAVQSLLISLKIEFFKTKIDHQCSFPMTQEHKLECSDSSIYIQSRIYLFIVIYNHKVKYSQKISDHLVHIIFINSLTNT